MSKIENQFEISILIVDDELDFRNLLSARLGRKGYRVMDAANGLQALQILRNNYIDVVLLDLVMPEMDGMAFLEQNTAPVQTIVLTGNGTVETAIEAMKKGAYDYLIKPYNIKELEALIEKAAEKNKLALENERLRGLMGAKVKEKGIIAESELFKKQLILASKVAKSDSPVLLTGESGTGKEILARYIYEESLRNTKPFIPINMGAIPESIMESELFGHEKGAFTGAVNQKKGLFEIAQGGTLFLDEIGDMPFPLQVKLLRFLESGEFRRIGGSELLKVNVRIIAATNVELEARVKSGEFREDLYYRLNVVEIKIPPLRERKEDILPLAYFFLAKNNPSKKLTEEGIRALLEYKFPGNVRELSHIVERGSILSTSEMIDKEHMFPSEGCISKDIPLEEIKYESYLSLRELERQHIQKIMEFTNGNKTKAAEILGISLRNLYRKLEDI